MTTSYITIVVVVVVVVLLLLLLLLLLLPQTAPGPIEGKALRLVRRRRELLECSKLSSSLRFCDGLMTERT